MKKFIMFLSNIILKSKHNRSFVFPTDTQTRTRIYQKGLCLRTDPSAALANASMTKKHRKPVLSSPASLATKQKSPNLQSSNLFCGVITAELTI